jgi:transposase-like protein
MTVGRPSKFTPERRDAILQSIRNRIPYELAAEANGIGERTLYEWIEKGQNHLLNEIDSDFANFAQSIKKVEQENIIQHLLIINGMPKNWQAHAWILERRWWKYFSSNPAIIDFQKQLDHLKKKELTNGQ